MALDGLSDSVRYDPTSDIGIRLEVLARKMHSVEEACVASDEYLGPWIFRHVAYGDTITRFEAEGAPFSRDMFYSRLRKYYYILDKLKE